MSQNQKRLNFRVGVSDDKTRFYIDDIPDDVWDKFIAYCEEVYPEGGKKAWSNIMAQVITNPYIIDAAADFARGKDYTFIMTGVPEKAASMLEALMNGFGMDGSQLVAMLYDRAQGERLSVFKFGVHKDGKPDELINDEHSHTIVLIDVPSKSINNMDKLARQIDAKGVGDFLGLLFQWAYWGAMTIERTSPKPWPQNGEAASEVEKKQEGS